MEYFRIPRDVNHRVPGQSTTRCGIIVNVTPSEPGWEGYVTFRFSNTYAAARQNYAGGGCAQVLFFQGDGNAP